MRTLGLLLFASLLLAAAIMMACGSPAAPMQNTTGILQSITVSPSTASSEVQFTAAGYYNTPPSPVKPLKATWAACFQNNPTQDVTITSSGMAQCAVGASGNYSVSASDFGSEACLAISPCGGGCQISGYAQLTCP